MPSVPPFVQLAPISLGAPTRQPPPPPPNSHSQSPPSPRSGWTDVVVGDASGGGGEHSSSFGPPNSHRVMNGASLEDERRRQYRPGDLGWTTTPSASTFPRDDDRYADATTTRTAATATTTTSGGQSSGAVSSQSSLFATIGEKFDATFDTFVPTGTFPTTRARGGGGGDDDERDVNVDDGGTNAHRGLAGAMSKQSEAAALAASRARAAASPCDALGLSYYQRSCADTFGCGRRNAVGDKTGLVKTAVITLLTAATVAVGLVAAFPSTSDGFLDAGTRLSRCSPRGSVADAATAAPASLRVLPDTNSYKQTALARTFPWIDDARFNQYGVGAVGVQLLQANSQTCITRNTETLSTKLRFFIFVVVRQLRLKRLGPVRARREPWPPGGFVQATATFNNSTRIRALCTNP